MTITGGIGDHDITQISNNESEKLKEVQQERIDAFTEHDEAGSVDRTEKNSEIKEIAEAQESLDRTAVEPLAEIQASENLQVSTSEDIEKEIKETMDTIPEVSEVTTAKISLSPDDVKVAGIGEGGITITAPSANETVMIDTVPLPESPAEKSVSAAPEAIIDSNDGTSREAIIDSNDGISAKAIIDSNDSNLITGEQNPVLAEPPTWSDQMDQGGVEDAPPHAPPDDLIRPWGAAAGSGNGGDRNIPETGEPTQADSNEESPTDSASDPLAASGGGAVSVENTQGTAGDSADEGKENLEKYRNQLANHEKNLENLQEDLQDLQGQLKSAQTELSELEDQLESHEAGKPQAPAKDDFLTNDGIFDTERYEEAASYYVERRTEWVQKTNVLESRIEAQEEIIVNLEKDIIDKQADIEKRIQTINNFSDLLGKGT
jgi:hypothetical protein